MPGRAGGDVQDPAAAVAPHAGDDELGQVERADDLDLEHQVVAAGGEVHDRGEVGDGGVADQDVRRAELRRGRGDQAFPFFGLGQVDLDRYRGAAGRADVADGLAEGALELIRARLSGAGRAAATAAPAAPNRRAISAPMPRLAPVTMATLPSRMPMPITPWCTIGAMNTTARASF
jgi:hypothetical protein